MSNTVAIHLTKICPSGSNLSLISFTTSQKVEIFEGQSSSLQLVLPGTLIQFSIQSHGQAFASSSLSVDLVSEKPQTFWLKFKPLQQSTDAKVKLTVSKILNQEKLADCPYLQLLSDGKAEDRLSARLRSGQTESRTLRINFEPDAPSRLGAEVRTYEVQSLADLDSARLESIGGDQIKKQVKVLSEEIQKIGLTPVQPLRSELISQTDSRVRQEESFEKFVENAVLELSELISALNGLENQRSSVQQEISQAEHNRNEVNIDIDALKGQLGGLQREVLMLKAERLRFKDLESLLESSKAFNKAQSENLEKLRKKFELSKEQAGKIRKKSRELILKLEFEAKDFQTKIEKIADNENRITEHNLMLKSQLAEIKLKLSQQKNSNALDPSKSTDQRYTGLTKLQALQDKAFEYDQESKLKYKASLQQKHSSYDQLLMAYRNYEDILHKNLEKTIEKYLVSNELIYMEQSCCIIGDVSNLTETLSKFSSFYSSTSKCALKFLDSTTCEVLKETENIKNECSKIGDVMNGVLEKDLEADRVRGIMAEIKERHPPFIPTLDDPVDVALFEYMKSCEEPIPIPFTREEQGVYLFGTKRVFLKLENGNLAIRIGGGFTSIQSFIEVYTPIELERQEEAIEECVPQFKNSQARFSHSPRKGMSPQRAARILQGAVEVQESGTFLKSHSPMRKTPIRK